jgi:hypothetical protein
VGGSYAPREQDPGMPPAPPITEPDPSALICPGDKVGPCTGCQRKAHRYGSGGSPQWCMETVKSGWGPSVRFVSTRPQEQREPG